MQERVKFLGVIASAAAAGLAIVMLAQAFQFGEAAPGDARAVLAAPQASIMQALVQGFMSRQPVAWVLFSVGAMIAVGMEMLRVPALVFALGMYLPLELNLPALVGGALVALRHRAVRARRRRRAATMRERGVIVASGLHGRRRARRRDRRRAAPVPVVSRRSGAGRRSSTSSRSRRRCRSSASSLFCVYLWCKATRAPQRREPQATTP